MGEVKLDWFTRGLMALAPRMALTRVRHQLATKMVAKTLRGYDAASSGRRTAGWRTPATSSNAENSPNLSRLRFIGRDLERNNPWAVKALYTICSNVVGEGILVKAVNGNTVQRARAEKLWKQWAESTACDFDGIRNFYSIQDLVMRTVARDGECLVRFRRNPDMPNVPLQLQVLEPDYLDPYRIINPDTGNRVIDGVEVDMQGRRVAYWLYPHHPGDTRTVLWFNALVSHRVPMGEVAHVFRQDRPGQLRAVSWFAPVAMTLRDLGDYESAELVRQKIAACFTAFVTDINAGDDITTDMSQDPLSEVLEKVEPGIVEYLPPGKDVKFAQPPTTNGFSDFTRTQLRKVAAGVGLTYESLTGDMSQTNFSSARMGWIEMGRNVESWRWRLLIPMLCIPVWEHFIQAASVAGPSLKGIDSYWTAPRRETIDPLKETEASMRRMRAGIQSWSETARENGYDPEALAAEMAEDIQRFDRYGLVLDCDPRKTTLQGLPRVRETVTDKESLPPDDLGDDNASNPAN